MSIADTAELNVLLKLKDQLSGPTTAATAKIKGLEAAAGTASTRGVNGLTGSLNKAGTATTGFGGKLSKAGANLKSFAFGPLGLIGVTGGILGLGAAITGGIDSLKRLDDVTTQTNAVLRSTKGVAGETAQSVRDLANRYEDLNATIDDKVIQSAENLLLTFTSIRKDAFEPALKAALDMNQAMGGGEAGLQSTVIQLGKALQDPIKGITALRRVGVNFSVDQIKQIKTLISQNKLYDAQKLILKELGTEFGGSFTAGGKTATATFAKLGDTIEDLEASFATALLPGLTSVSRALSDALANPAVQHGIEDLGKSFAGLFSAANVRQAGIIGDQLGTLFKGVQAGWSALPDPLKQLLITGLVVGKVSKILFDFGPLDFAKLGVGLAGGLGKSLFQRGGTPANPLFVTDVAGDLGKAGAAGIPGAAGLTGLLKVALPAAVAAAVVIGFKSVQDQQAEAQANAIGDSVGKQVSGGASLADLKQSLASLDEGIAGLQGQRGGPLALLMPGLNQLLYGGQIKSLQEQRAILQATIDSRAVIANTLTSEGARDRDKLEDIATASDYMTSAVLGVKDGIRSLHGPLNKLDAAFSRDFHSLIAATKANDVRKFADKVANEIHRGVGSLATTERTLDHLKARRDAALKAGQTDLAHRLGRDIAKVEAKIPGRQYVQRQISAAEKLYRSSEGNKAKLDGLRAITRDLRAHGDRHAANEVATLASLIGAVNSLPSRIHLNVTLPRYDPVHHATVPGKAAAGGFIPPNSVYFVGEDGPELAFGEGGGTRIVPIPSRAGRRTNAVGQLRSYFADVLSRTAAARVPYRDTPERRSLTVHLQQRLAAEVSTSSLTRATTINRRYGTQWS